MQEVKCYGCEDEECSFVFVDESIARTTTGDDFSPLEIKGETYYIASYGEHDQERVLIELMYACAHRDANWNCAGIHGKRALLQNLDVIGGRFTANYSKSGERKKGTVPLARMPTPEEMRDTLKSNLSYCVGSAERKAPRIRELIKLLKESLPSAKLK